MTLEESFSHAYHAAIEEWIRIFIRLTQKDAETIAEPEIIARGHRYTFEHKRGCAYRWDNRIVMVTWVTWNPIGWKIEPLFLDDTEENRRKIYQMLPF